MKYPFKHGHSTRKGETRTYRSWKSMMRRCFSEKNKNYNHYGGRGIKVCENWRDYSKFLSDMGERPPKMTLERKDNNGNYEPGNCLWASRLSQTRNRRVTVSLSHNGETKSVAEWAEFLQVPYGRLKARIKYGWPADKVLFTPLFASGERPIKKAGI